MQNVLIVGAGAVGAVYGYHLVRGGARVTYLIKEKYRAELADGMVLYPLKGPERGQTVRFSDYALVTIDDDLRDRGFDELWICVSSPALMSGWIDGLLPQLGDATILYMQAGLADRQYMEARVPPDRLCAGVIQMISWQAPLETETYDPPGIAYWWPPGKNPFSGPAERIEPIVERLNQGGWGSKIVKDAQAQTMFMSCIMMPYMAGLEISDWRFAKFGARGSALASQAAREARAILKPGGNPVVARMLSSRWGLRFVTWIMPKIMPFDVETYIRYHFTKVGDQTRDKLEHYQVLAKKDGLDAGGIKALADRLPPLVKPTAEGAPEPAPGTGG